ncbi:MAG: hypothetical protein IPL61_11370 [Myxococcales bacterium]|nr:hypothetical protein [Myxococcales bacterium]
MTARACPACAGKMSEATPVCPHCGHRVEAPPPGLGGLSRDEARALLVMHGHHGPPERRTVSSYLLPHPRTTGAGRTAELALLVVTAPLWALGLVGFAWSRRRYRAGSQIPMSEGRAAGTLALAGAPSLWLTTMWWLGSRGALALTVGLGIGWLARAVIRGRADDRVSLELSRLDAPAAPPPAARVVPAPPPAPTPASVSQPRLEPAASAAPVEVAAAPLEGGPRLLR